MCELVPRRKNGYRTRDFSFLAPGAVQGSRRAVAALSALLLACSHLVPLLAEDHERGVPEVPQLGEVEQVQHIEHRRVDQIEFVARHEAVPVPVRDDAGLDAHVAAHHNLGDVVAELEGVGVQLGHELEGHDEGEEEDGDQVADGDVTGGSEVGEEPAVGGSADGAGGIDVRENECLKVVKLLADGLDGQEEFGYEGGRGGGEHLQLGGEGVHGSDSN